MKRPTLSACIVTQDMGHFLPAVLRNVDPIVDEIVVVDAFSQDRTVELLRGHPKVVMHQREWPDHWGDQKNFAISQATMDWVLVIDSDELLGDRLREKIPALLRTRRYTHYKFPRYWLVSGPPWTHVASDVHYPDLQLRLFRNVPHFRYELDRAVHSRFPRKGRGPGRKLRRHHLFHFDFLLRSRAERESKIERYRGVEPQSTHTSEMYVYENGERVLRRCREPLEMLPELEALAIGALP